MGMARKNGMDVDQGAGAKKEKKPHIIHNPADWGLVYEGDMFDPSDYSPFDPDLREKYLLENPEWRYDTVPQMIDGKNIIDYIDPDIDQRLEELEREEEEQVAELEREMEEQDLDIDEDDLDKIRAFHRRRKKAHI